MPNQVDFYCTVVSPGMVTNVQIDLTPLGGGDVHMMNLSGMTLWNYNFIVASNFPESTNMISMTAYDDLSSMIMTNVLLVIKDSVDITPPAIASLISPASNSYAASATVTFVWHPSTDAETGISGYLLEVDNTSGAFGDLAVSSNVSASVTNITVPLTAGIKYWRVRAVNGGGTYSDVYDLWDFTIDITEPSTVVLASPGSNTRLGAVPGMTWNASLDAESGITGYVVELDDNPGFGSIDWNTNVVGTSTTPVIPADGTYYWRVRAVNGAGLSSADSIVWLFELDTTAPGNVTGLTILTQESALALSWTNPGDSDLAGIRVVRNGLAYPTNISDGTFVDLGAVTEYTDTGLANGSDYYYRVYAFDEVPNYDSGVIVLGTPEDQTPPGIVVQTAPPDQSVVSVENVLMSWNAATDTGSGVVGYELQDDTNPGFSTPAVIVTNALSAVFTASPGITNYWRVRAWDAVGNTNAWSTVWTYIVNTNQIIPFLHTPLDLTLTNGLSIDFTWSWDSDVDMYMLVIHESNMTGPQVYSNVTMGLTNLSTVLPSDGTYVWRVKAHKLSTMEWQDWSSEYTINIDTLQPSTPVLSFPPDTSITSNNFPVFSWNGSLDASGIAWYEIAIDAAVSNAGATLSFASSPLTDGTVSWRVRAVDNAGNTGVWSDLWTVNIDTTPPSAPILHLPLNGTTTNTNSIFFTWSIPFDVNGIASYWLEIDDDPLFGSFDDGGMLGATNYLSWDGLAYTTYYWRVHAEDSAGNVSAYGATNFVSFDNTVLVPAAPSWVNVTVISTNIIDVYWENIANETSYTLYFATLNDTNSASVYGNTLTDTSNLAVTSLVPATTYYFWVKAANAGGISGFSPVGSGRTLYPSPQAPLWVTATVISSNRIDLTWSNVTSETAFTPYRSTVNDTNAAIPVSGTMIDWTNFPHTGLMSDTVYYFWVKAVNPSGVSAFSPVTSATTLPGSALLIPSEPVWVTATAISSNTIVIAWENVANETSYTLYKSMSNDTNTAISQAGFLTDITNFTDNGLATSSVWYYWVKAFNVNGGSAYSVAGSAATLPGAGDVTPPPAPLLVLPPDLLLTNGNVADLVWNPVSDPSGIDHYVYDINGITNFNAGTTAAGASLSEGTNTWRVYAVDGASNAGIWSITRRIISDTISPSKPNIISPADAGTTAETTPVFSWTASTDANGIMYYVLIIDGVTNVTPETNLVPGSALSQGAHTWDILAVDGAGNIGPSGGPSSFTIDSGLFVGAFTIEPDFNRIDDDGIQTAQIRNVNKLINTFTGSNIPDGEVFYIQLLQGIADLQGTFQTNGLDYVESLNGDILFGISGTETGRVTFRVSWASNASVFAETSLLISPEMLFEHAVPFKRILNPEVGEVLQLYLAEEHAEEEVTIRIYDIQGRNLIKEWSGVLGVFEPFEWDLRDDSGGFISDKIYGIIIHGSDWDYELKFVVNKRYQKGGE